MTQLDFAHTVSLSMHSIEVAVLTNEESLRDEVIHDFHYFSVADTTHPAICIEHVATEPPYVDLPTMESYTATPRNISYRHGSTHYVDYFGKALLVMQQGGAAITIYASDTAIAREIIFLTILSRVSERLDYKGLHRVHALGIAHRGRGHIVLLPSGGGKTTLALSLLRESDSEMTLVSEDSPLLARGGLLYPFPLRIGVLAGSKLPDIAEKYLKPFPRMEFGPKVTIDVLAFEGRIASEAVTLGSIIIGLRSTGHESYIRRISRWQAAQRLFMFSVVGFGLYQGMEFLAQKSGRDILRHLWMLFSRARTCGEALLRAKTYEFVIGTDRNKAVETLTRFVDGFASFKQGAAPTYGKARAT